MPRSARTGTASSPAARPSIRSFFVAAEPSYDFNWMRFRGAGLFASGDGDPYDDTEARLRRDLREPDLRRRRHQLLDPPDHPLRRRRPRGRRSTAATASSTRCAPRRSRASRTSTIPGTMLLGVGADFDLTPRAAPVGQRQPSLVPPAPRAAGAAQRGLDPPRHRLGPVGRGDLAAAGRPRTSSSALSARGAAAGQGLPRPVRQLRPATGAIIRSCSTRS